MNVMKFGYHLLDDDHDGKKWKNGLRTILIQQTAALFDRRNLSGDELQQFGLVDDGNYEKRDDDLTRFRVQTEWSQTYGLIIKVRDYLSSNKKKVNTKSASSTKTVYEKTISDPDQVVKTLFGSDARVEQTYKIEDLIDLIVNNFKDDKEKLNKIMEQSIIKVILAIYIDLSHKGWSEWGYPPKMNQYVTDPDSRKNIAIEVDRKVYNNEKIA